MDTQEPCAQSESDVHKAQTANTDATAQGANPDKATNPDEAANPDDAANPDKDQFLMIQLLLRWPHKNL